MMLHSRGTCAVIALIAVGGCGPVYTDVEFEPVNEAGSAAGGSLPNVLGAGGAVSGSSGSSGSGASTSHGGVEQGSGGTSGARMAEGGAAGSSPTIAAGNGGTAGMAPQASECDGLAAWQPMAYALGQRVVSTCLPPYNGACPVNETREFECQPPTGTVGLGWCGARQPGVINGWTEAWIMRAPCPKQLD